MTTARTVKVWDGTEWVVSAPQIVSGTALPDQATNTGKFLTTDGTTVSWETVDALPTQTSNGGKYLTTDGNNASWDTVTSGTSASDLFMMMGA